MVSKTLKLNIKLRQAVSSSEFKISFVFVMACDGPFVESSCYYLVVVRVNVRNRMIYLWEID